MQKHLMIDLETMSTEPNAAIIQIGAVIFDPLSSPLLPPLPRVGPSYPQAAWHWWCNVDLRSCEKMGLHIDGNTVVWWLQQPKEVQDTLFNQAPISINQALHELSIMVGVQWDWGDCCVWSHGATFDCVILDQAYRAVEKRAPWQFRKVRDTRTLFDLVDPNQKIAWEEIGPKHHALWDAWRQAVKVQKCYTLLKKWKDRSDIFDRQPELIRFVSEWR